MHYPPSHAWSAGTHKTASQFWFGGTCRLVEVREELLCHFCAEKSNTSISICLHKVHPIHHPGPFHLLPMSKRGPGTHRQDRNAGWHIRCRLSLPCRTVPSRFIQQLVGSLESCPFRHFPYGVPAHLDCCEAHVLGKHLEH